MPRRFEFRLQPVLKVRTVAEERIKRKFATLSAEIARLGRLDELAVSDIRERQAALLDRQRHPRLDLNALAAERAWIGRLRLGMLEREAQRRLLEDRRQKVREELIQARMQRCVLERLKERRLAEHRAGLERHEQNQADELAQQMHNRRAAASGGDAA